MPRSTKKSHSERKKMLAREDQKLKARIAKLTAEYISQVNIDKMVSLVYSSLNAIRVEELWDRSG